MSVTRKLTAILSADVKGYSRLISEDEEATVRTLTAYREVMASLIQEHRGRVVDSPGDNLLAEFASVMDAVQCAAAIQHELKTRNDALADDRKMEFRIGINLGDVIVDGERIYGDGVNVAARVEGLAEGGGVCISGTVYDQVKTKLALGYEYLGEQEVKNIPEPIRAYRVLMEPEAAGTVAAVKRTKSRRWVAAAAVAVVVIGGAAVWNFYLRAPSPQFEPASVEKMAFPLPQKPSIAVLPFENLSGDPEQEYFSDGLTDTLITGLAKVPGIFVIARNSTFVYKKKPVKVRRVAEELGVQYVLEGSVQKVGGRVRVNAQLIDALKGHHLWAERYDRPIKDAFAVQDEIARKVITALKGEVQQAGLPAQGASTAEGLDSFLRGMANILRFTKEDNALARQMFEKAVELEPQWVQPWVLLGRTHRLDGLFRWGEDPRKSFKRAAELAEKALALDAANPAANALMGNIYLDKREHEKAITYGRKSVALAPNYAHMLVFLAITLSYSGQPEEAIELVKKAMRMNPRHPVFYLATLGRGYYLLGQYDKATKVFKKALVRRPSYYLTLPWLAVAYSRKGENEKARAEIAKLLRLRPKYSAKLYAQVSRFKNPADLRRDLDALRKAGLPENPPLPLPDKPSIAVLPFTNMSGDPKQGYLADGITENIITTLAQVPDMFVIARNSTFTYKGKAVKVQQVGRELGVRYVLEGSFQKSGDRVRITAQLVDAKTGNHLWAERYDREFKDIFALQDDITLNIVSAMEVKLTEGEAARIRRRQTNNPEAYELFLRGREVFRRMTKADNAQGRRLLQKAVSLDPNFAAAWTYIGATHWLSVRLGWSADRARDSARAEELAQKALAIDDSDANAYFSLGQIFLNKRQYEKAIAYAEKSVALQPNHARNTLLLGLNLVYVGRGEEGLQLVKRAIRLSPYPKAVFLRILGLAYRSMGQYDEAIAAYERARARNPSSPFSHIFLAVMYAEAGRLEEARAAVAELLKRNPKFSVKRAARAIPFKDPAEQNRIRDALRKAGLPE